MFVVGCVISIPFRGVFLRLGEQGVFVGLAISMVYYGLLHSRFGHGQTLGKELLRLRVVRPDGKLLSLDRSLFRFAKDPVLASSTSFLQQPEGLGISYAGVVTRESSINFGPKTVTVMVSGFVSHPAGVGDPDWPALHAAVMKRLKPFTTSNPGEAPDALGTALATGFNLGIFKSHETEAP